MSSITIGTLKSAFSAPFGPIGADKPTILSIDLEHFGHLFDDHFARLAQSWQKPWPQGRSLGRLVDTFDAMYLQGTYKQST
jgi:hypothetical protein